MNENNKKTCGKLLIALLVTFFFIAFFSPLIDIACATPFFSDSFETGTFSLWDNIRVTDSSTLTIASDYPYEGSYCLKSTYETSGDDGFTYINFGPQKLVNYSFMGRWDNLPAANGKRFSISMIMMDDGGDVPPAFFNMAEIFVDRSSDGKVRWLLAARANGSYGSVGVSYDNPPVEDTYFHISLVVQCSSVSGVADGSYLLSVNGVQCISVLNVDTTYTYVDFLRCGVDRNSIDVQSNAVWIDNVSITSEVTSSPTQTPSTTPEPPGPFLPFEYIAVLLALAVCGLAIFWVWKRGKRKQTS
jgi:hypothetical protein